MKNNRIIKSREQQQLVETVAKCAAEARRHPERKIPGEAGAHHVDVHPDTLSTMIHYTDVGELNLLP